MEVITLLIGLLAVWFILSARKQTRRRYYGPKAGFDRGQAQSAPLSLENQLSALRATKITKRRPVNRSAFQVQLALEKGVRQHAPKARVLPEVGMGAFLSTAGGGDLLPEDREAFRAFAAKRVDFLVIDGQGMPAFAVEYQGSGHYMGDSAAGRDAVKREALRLAGVELVEIHDHTGQQERDALIVGAIQRNITEKRSF